MKPPFAVLSLLIVVAVATVGVVPAALAEGAGEVGEALRGNWVCVSAVVDGKPLKDATVKELRLTITADRYRTERGDEVLFDSTYRLDSAKDPKQIEMTGTEGEAAGKAALGIYKVDGDRLTICYVMPGGERPRRFESTPGSKAYLVTWERAVR